MIRLKRGRSKEPHDRIILLGLLAQGWPEGEILRNYLGLEPEDLLACWAYASEVLSEQKVYRYEAA